MKLLTIFSFVGVLFLTTACPGSKYESNLDKLKDNNMNFPDLDRYHFEEISFMKPEMLDQEYSDSYILSDVYETFIAYDIYLHFSVELFTSSYIDVIQYSFDEELSELDAVHDNYVIKRSNSLNESSASIKKEIPESVGQKGYIQVVHGSQYDYDEVTSYFIATVVVKGEIYVFQMTGKKENMGYLYDDFINIISSIEA